MKHDITEILKAGEEEKILLVFPPSSTLAEENEYNITVKVGYTIDDIADLYDINNDELVSNDFTNSILDCLEIEAVYNTKNKKYHSVKVGFVPKQSISSKETLKLYLRTTARVDHLLELSEPATFSETLFLVAKGLGISTIAVKENFFEEVVTRYALEDVTEITKGWIPEEIERTEKYISERDREKET